MFSEQGEVNRFLQENHERVGEGIDYNSIILNLYFAALQAPDHTNVKDFLINALETALHAYRTPTYDLFRDRFEKSAAYYRSVYREQEWEAEYQKIWLEALGDLMKEIGLLPVMRI